MVRNDNAVMAQSVRIFHDVGGTAHTIHLTHICVCMKLDPLLRRFIAYSLRGQDLHFLCVEDQILGIGIIGNRTVETAPIPVLDFVQFFRGAVIAFEPFDCYSIMSIIDIQGLNGLAGCPDYKVVRILEDFSFELYITHLICNIGKSNLCVPVTPAFAAVLASCGLRCFYRCWLGHFNTADFNRFHFVLLSAHMPAGKTIVCQCCGQLTDCSRRFRKRGIIVVQEDDSALFLLKADRCIAERMQRILCSTAVFNVLGGFCLRPARFGAFKADHNVRLQLFLQCMLQAQCSFQCRKLRNTKHKDSTVLFMEEAYSQDLRLFISFGRKDNVA